MKAVHQDLGFFINFFNTFISITTSHTSLLLPKLRLHHITSIEITTPNT